MPEHNTIEIDGHLIQARAAAEAVRPPANVATHKNSVLIRMAERFGVDANKLMATLKATAFKGDVTNEQFMALMIVADQYKLNPLTKEIYAFPDKNNGIVPVVGVDGWARIINEHPQVDGIEFTDGPPDGKEQLPAWIECTIHRKDRSKPVVIREYMAECKRGTGPWGSHPRRMLRHKAMIQCGRIAFGFVGIYDQDEAERIIEGDHTIVVDQGVSELNAELKGAPPAPTVIEAQTGKQGQAAPAKPKPAGQIEPESTIATPQATQVADPMDGELQQSEIGPVTYSSIATAIGKAKTTDELDAAADLIRTLGSEQMRAELDVEARAKRKSLSA